MKTTLITTLLLFMQWGAIAQNREYKPLDSLGWEMINLNIAGGLNELDTGAVTYLVTINNKGKTLKLKQLDNSFRNETEKLLRRAVTSSSFKKTEGLHSGQKKVTGTVTITIDLCHNLGGQQPVSTKEQIEMFRDPQK